MGETPAWGCGENSHRRRGLIRRLLRRNEMIQRKKNAKDALDMETGCTEAGKQE